MNTTFDTDTTAAADTWQAVNGTRRVTGAGTALSFSHGTEFRRWSRSTERLWSPTGPALRDPPTSPGEALALALAYLDAVCERGSFTAVTGQIPDLAPVVGGDDPQLIY